MMYTQFDKALVAAIMGVVQLANVWGFHWGIDEATVTHAIAFATPILVFLIPNKIPKDV